MYLLLRLQCVAIVIYQSVSIFTNVAWFARRYIWLVGRLFEKNKCQFSLDDLKLFFVDIYKEISSEDLIKSWN